jgi:hypothetical protein
LSLTFRTSAFDFLRISAAAPEAAAIGGGRAAFGRQMAKRFLQPQPLDTPT